MKHKSNMQKSFKFRRWKPFGAFGGGKIGGKKIVGADGNTNEHK